jgi:hypothetical protein
MQRDFFVLDPGAAQREAGFHRMLAAFIGWHLPKVRRFDGDETTLYLETIFPLLYVEQKSGWSSIPAAFPTYFQIRDVGPRAVEFLMALGTHELQLTRQKLDLEFAASKAAWAAKLDELHSIAGLVNARVEGATAAPTIAMQDIERSFLLVADSGSLHPLDEWTSFIRSRVAELSSADVPSVEAVAGETSAELDHLTTTFTEQNARRNALFRARQEQLSQIASIARRLAALEEDLQKNLDTQKLRKFGSKISETFAAADPRYSVGPASERRGYAYRRQYRVHQIAGQDILAIESPGRGGDRRDRTPICDSDDRSNRDQRAAESTPRRHGCPLSHAVGRHGSRTACHGNADGRHCALWEPRLSRNEPQAFYNGSLWCSGVFQHALHVSPTLTMTACQEQPPSVIVCVYASFSSFSR